MKCEVEKAHIPNVDRFWQHTVVDNSASEKKENKRNKKDPLEGDCGPSPTEGEGVKIGTSIYEETASEEALHMRRFIDVQVRLKTFYFELLNHAHDH